ncbi:uncharacterized protein AKAME5_001746600 [Lates japonicus]|uniref:Uncharacterized protein n=1 Tax=Lates japonicus TaxID=270547 RepID=A0AAD3N700_LATJO|nr:uncharacterized protein AKAME5_001746600 [Lates japonicus]
MLTPHCSLHFSQMMAMICASLGLKHLREVDLWANLPVLSISLQAMYLPVKRNQVVDFLSHHKSPPGEWQLHPEVVRPICGFFGRAEVDLFASEVLTHCLLWLSLAEETSPLGMDMVSPSAQALLQSAMASSQQEGSPVPVRSSELASPSLSPPAVCLAPGGSKSLLSGCMDAVRQTILTARAPSTRLQYENRWKLFSHWCAASRRSEDASPKNHESSSLGPVPSVGYTMLVSFSAPGTAFLPKLVMDILYRHASGFLSTFPGY